MCPLMCMLQFAQTIFVHATVHPNYLCACYSRSFVSIPHTRSTLYHIGFGFHLFPKYLGTLCSTPNMKGPTHMPKVHIPCHWSIHLCHGPKAQSTGLRPVGSAQIPLVHTHLLLGHSQGQRPCPWAKGPMAQGPHRPFRYVHSKSHMPNLRSAKLRYAPQNKAIVRYAHIWFCPINLTFATLTPFGPTNLNKDLTHVRFAHSRAILSLASLTRFVP